MCDIFVKTINQYSLTVIFILSSDGYSIIIFLIDKSKDEGERYLEFSVLCDFSHMNFA